MSEKNNEILYNGIQLPENWPPRYSFDKKSLGEDPPYIINPPEEIKINIGRQLFVDDFLIEKTNCKRVYGKPVIHPDSPIVFPETEEELDNGNCPMAAPFNDGVWYDVDDKLFKMWYMPGWFHTIAYATSEDGIHWKKNNQDIKKNTNLVWEAPEGSERDGSLVWLDTEEKNRSERFKLFQFYRIQDKQGDSEHEEGWFQTSSDGIHWERPHLTNHVGDNTSFFYNPFRKKWCMSVRRSIPAIDSNGKLPIGIRSRFYVESDTFSALASWNREEDEFLWQLTDEKDLPDSRFPNHEVTLYDLNCVAYESIMLGLFGIFRGPENHICAQKGIPKTIDLEVGYSRDGFHFSRPDRTPFLASSRKIGDWNRGYLHASGGLCLVVDDLLYFYFTGFSGISPKLSKNDTGSPGRMRNAMYAGASTGLAILRRDGFVGLQSLKKEGYIITRTLSYSGKYLFINGDFSSGQLSVEVLDSNASTVPGFEKEKCIPIIGNYTKMMVKWNGNELKSIDDKKIKLKFHITNGTLFSFWISETKNGESNGFVAAGGPEFKDSRDH